MGNKNAKSQFTRSDTYFLPPISPVKEVVENHKRDGRPLAAWKNGKTVMISANKIK